MKVAVFHNFMDNIGGAEIVALILARELNADFYTTNIDEDKIRKMGFPGIRIKSIGKVPVNPPFRHQAALARFRRLNLGNKYDFYIIAGDWAMSAAVNHKPNLWYVHSPIREIWDLYDYVRRSVVPPSLRRVFDLWVTYNRHLNRKYLKHVQEVVCNSKNTQRRIRKFLNHESTVINPPVETSKFYYGAPGDYWLSVNRLFYHKRVEMQIKAFQKLPDEKLVIVGSYERSRHFRSYASYIESIKPKNVRILNWAYLSELAKLYANCRGFIATARDEDFGMTPVEAMASGKPVVACNEGGYKETVVDGITGRLIDDIDEEKLARAVREIGRTPEKYKDVCIEQAKNFSTEI